MRTTLTCLAIILGIVGSASLSAQNAPIDNSKRPGAGAPNCAKLAETTDKCVFHTKKDQVDIVRLPVDAYVSWKATASNPALVAVGESKLETAADGTRQQVIRVVPQTSGDADVVLKLEKGSEADAAAPATETRHINLMIHATAAAKP
jgi:hypothetical protein